MQALNDEASTEAQLDACRFAYQQALRSWPECEEAQKGLGALAELRMAQAEATGTGVFEVEALTGGANIAKLAEQARRGLHRVPVLTAETRFPLGNFRVWTVWRPAARVLVYPAPEPQAPPLPPGEPRAGSGVAAGARASGEFDGVRAYQLGDPTRLIVWKKFAKSEELVSRDTQQLQRQALWLDHARAGSLDA